MSDDAQVAAMVDRTVAEFGRLDAAFNNAGVMARIAPTAESTREDWDRVIGINLRGVWSCMRHELRQMERQGSGAIVNNASVGALTGNPGIGSYIASKHGVVGLTRTAALEYVKHGIRVNAVNPGLIDTQIARDVVSGDEQAYAEIAKHVPIGRAGQARGNRVGRAVALQSGGELRGRPCPHRGRRLDGAVIRDLIRDQPLNKSPMPHVIVKLWPGKSEEHKSCLAEGIAQAGMDVLNYGDESVSVAVDEIRTGR